MSFAKDVWTTLAAIDCNDKVNKKGNLAYLSWAWAWAELMSKYPESEYVFLEPITDASGTVEVWVNLTIKEGDKSITRQMWLPVMDYKNNSVINPSSRQVSDTRMRCLTKAMAMFGLGHYIYAGEDLPDPEVSKAAEANKQQALHEHLLAKYGETVKVISEAIAENNLSTAKEAWDELTEDEKREIWVAPTKGGVFTTKEREIMKSTEFRKANGEGDE